MWFYWLVSIVACAGIGGLLGSLVNQTRNGAVLGGVLGPIGWIVLFVLPKGLRPQNTGLLVVMILVIIIGLLVINALVR
ncbi:MAG: hypothetical protein HOM69_05915 [Gammaproteobacteria bacterium]|jgi:hypothetical protein|nr:hypothetical protein [Gammaproteobacteria bacterium]MBT5052744.1 hypothetical protein [Gammaproteobacteria bacterium]